MISRQSMDLKTILEKFLMFTNNTKVENMNQYSIYIYI